MKLCKQTCRAVDLTVIMKRKAPKTDVRQEKHIPPVHNFSEEEVRQIRCELLGWYRKHKRDLPWRRQVANEDINQRAYAVWVSEIMLQQTQVATVLSYYNKWMKKWPTLQALAAASLEEVNEMWSGLGYYSRGRRLHEGAVKVVEQLNGEMPKTAESLLKELSGVGKYTAGAIASIAYNQCTGLVDGNVVRVLCRLRLIGADSTSQQVTDALWSHANSLVDPDAPGDFNQAMMELGATVCTPKGPECSTCPLRTNCKAHAQVQEQKNLAGSKLGQKTDLTERPLLDIECLADSCALCLPESESWDPTDGVMNYPRKGKKKAAREETTAVCVLCRNLSEGSPEYFIVQRPPTGLLAGLWEFPSQTLDQDDSSIVSYPDICQKYGVHLDHPADPLPVGEVVHIFSHIHQTYQVKGIVVNQSDIELTMDSNQSTRWVTKQQFMDAAVSTAMKKVFKAFETALSGKGGKAAGSKKTKTKQADVTNQPSISNFFKPRS